jgi:Helix-turn-helix domain
MTMIEALLSEYLSEHETAKQLQLSPRTLKRWRALKSGPAITRIGRRIVYKRSTVAAWIKNQEVS